MAEKLVRAAHDARTAVSGKRFPMDSALATSMGLADESFSRLMRDAGFRFSRPKALPAGAYGPLAPLLWDWRPPRKDQVSKGGGRRHKKDRKPGGRNARPAGKPREGNVFAQLANLVK